MSAHIEKRDQTPLFTVWKPNNQIIISYRLLIMYIITKGPLAWWDIIPLVKRVSMVPREEYLEYNNSTIFPLVYYVYHFLVEKYMCID